MRGLISTLRAGFRTYSLGLITWLAVWDRVVRRNDEVFSALVVWLGFDLA